MVGAFFIHFIVVLSSKFDFIFYNIIKVISIADNVYRGVKRMPKTTENYYHVPVADISVEAISLVKDIQDFYRESKKEVLQTLD